MHGTAKQIAIIDAFYISNIEGWKVLGWHGY